MRVPYLYSSRRTGRVSNISKQREKFPDIAKKVIEDSDIILEILDARFLTETHNFDLEESIRETGKRIIYVFNKADLIDRSKINTAKIKLRPYVFVSSRNRAGSRELRERIKSEAGKIDKEGKILVGVLGYPNTGKSSIINVLVGKAAARTSSEAGLTKGIQKIKLTSNINIMDTPGVIPVSEYNPHINEIVAKHVKIGARTQGKINDPEIVIAEIMREFPGKLEGYYSLDQEEDPEIFLEKLGRKWGFLKKGGEIDENRTAVKIIKDWQEGLIKI